MITYTKYKEMYGRILKSLHIVNLYREMFKDVRANCFWASLLHTQIYMPRHASSARAKY